MKLLLSLWLLFGSLWLEQAYQPAVAPVDADVTMSMDGTPDPPPKP